MRYHLEGSTDLLIRWQVWSVGRTQHVTCVPNFLCLPCLKSPHPHRFSRRTDYIPPITYLPVAPFINMI
jgi:hypothetical protein